jgi:MGT family glycosyltransferase
VRLAFFAYAHNLAEVTRAIEVAKACQARGAEVGFFTHGGAHERRIRQAGFELTTLKPRITPEKNQYLMDLDQGRALGQPFTFDEWCAQVENELDALAEFEPDSVYAGMNLPSAITAKALQVPLIYLLPIAGTQPYFEYGLGEFPPQYENIFTRLLPKPWKDGALNWLMPRLSVGLGVFNRAAKHFGVKPARNLMDIIRGDLNLLTDIPELTGLPTDKLPADFRYVGPVFARLPEPVPAEVKRVFSREGLKIFCAMGSSGTPTQLHEAVNALKASGHNAVVATTSILDPADLGDLPENIYATRYVPAPEVNEMADIALVHGGQGTVQTACWAGTPVIGVGLQFEQEANLTMLERAGMGIQIPLRAYTEERIQAEIERVAGAPSYGENATRIRSIIRKTNGAKNAAKEIIAFLCNEEDI